LTLSAPPSLETQVGTYVVYLSSIYLIYIVYLVETGSRPVVNWSHNRKKPTNRQLFEKSLLASLILLFRPPNSLTTFSLILSILKPSEMYSRSMGLGLLPSEKYLSLWDPKGGKK